MANIFAKRLTKELRDLKNSPPHGIELQDPGDDMSCWKIKVYGASGTIYSGEVFVLQFKFMGSYPLDSPEVIFIESIPIHPHVYSNGHICLSILYDQWSPALTVSSVCLSIQSMLSSCTKKERPPDNNMYILTAKKSPKSAHWAFHAQENDEEILDTHPISIIVVSWGPQECWEYFQIQSAQASAGLRTIASTSYIGIL
ncbi:ubiquitin-conjugating enzyme/RWD-like protein [Polychytrium aggregatum]|uniref:ubiquitin-conjugating enzyme/RWD-like protein n=1 Tax=Polychytrium aggregatum TaxID=110093 RepID=UPI0022FE4C29|nr:ubiquitin-conjugating enzyme/RWD-like protein [Polychytrium aggregatum]KAI9203183.1 ubiquitin-conjugating enzyme/RWD-like protein [Polychytrium aggregatum]